MSDYPPPADPWSGGAPMGAPPLASWGLRVGAYLVDALIATGIYLVGLLLGFILGSASDAFRVVVLVPFALASLAFSIWNLVRQGRTGQTIGKGVLNIRLVRLDGINPPGIGLSIGRAFVHIVDALPCYIGFLWPLWDDKRQTFADKILNTVVVNA
ncbi:MAG TPA: RDD family protein [Acidimicrobiales bacterium]|nr:RDD family protein [Acidimicrobiales bacterium]